jgi:hypothetical protein
MPREASTDLSGESTLGQASVYVSDSRSPVKALLPCHKTRRIVRSRFLRLEESLMKRRLFPTLVLFGVIAALAGTATTAEAKAPVGTCVKGDLAPISEFPASLAFVDHNGDGSVCVFQIGTGTNGAANIIVDDVAMPTA